MAGHGHLLGGALWGPGCRGHRPVRDAALTLATQALGVLSWASGIGSGFSETASDTVCQGAAGGSWQQLRPLGLLRGLCDHCTPTQ